MRITHKNIYDSARIELSTTLVELEEANKVMTTGKRLNSLADDPAGITQVVDIKSNLLNIEQLERNISTGRTWLNTGETALSSVSDLLSEAMVISEQLASGTYSASQRESGAERINGILRQLITYSNSQVSGQYIFGGTKTDVLPFDLDNENNPTKVIYYGNEETFSVKTGKNATVTVGHNGKEVFRYNDIKIDSTNNKISFIEYTNGVAGSEVIATIPDGTYNHDQLATAMRTAMNVASASSGGSITYNVDYDSTTNKFAIRDNGARSGVHVELLWKSGTNAGNSIAPYIGFDLVDTRDALVSDTTAPSFPHTVNAGEGDLVFTEDNGAGPLTLTIDIAAAYTTGNDLANALEVAMDAESLANGYNINYDVSYDAANQKFIIEEADDTNLQELKIIQRGSDTTAFTALGLTEVDHTYAPPESDSEVDWSIFKSLIDLKGFLESNDVDGIARSMTILDNHFSSIVSKVSEIGSNDIRFNIREQVILELELSYTERQASIEDADITEAITTLKLKEFAYQAALASSARVMNMSLADYL